MRIVFILLAVLVTLGMAGTALAADPVATEKAIEGASWFFPAGSAAAVFGASIGAGIIVFGAAKGIGNIGASAVESIARQPEAGGRIFTAMLISAALIEGFTFFALLVPFLKA